MFKNLRSYLTIKRSKLFEERYYLLLYPDVRKADVDPLMHFIKFGWKEGRNPAAFFNSKFYLELYSDVVESKQNPFFHYIKYGKPENRLCMPIGFEQTDEKTI